MHYIDGPGSVDGQFSEGNPAQGQRATKVTAAWLNDLQNNLAFAITEAGFELAKSDQEQLYEAIVAIAAGAAGDGSGAVPTTRTVTGGGLVTGGGDLAVNRVLTVAKATSGEVAAGVRDDVAITPLALLGGVGGRVLAGTGYATFLGGIIIQWGTAFANANGSTNITLPTAFPAQCVFATFNGGTTGTGNEENNPFISNKSATALTAFSSANSGVSGQFVAIGF